MDSADPSVLSPAPPGQETTAPPRGSGGRATRPRRRWLVLAVAVELVLAAGLLVWRAVAGDQRPHGSAVATGTASPSAKVPAPVSAPLRPGLEPPRAGQWPKWMGFGSKESVTELHLDGLGFPLTVPSSWHCVLSGRASGYVRYICGVTAQADQIGGELIVRDCPAPCDARRQETMRRAEEAWGLRWREAGRNVTIAETTRLDDAAQYALVMVGYWRSAPGGPLDRQLVLRMTSPVSWLDTLRKVATGIRVTTAL